MRESSPVTFLLGVVLGFIARPIIMGCISSKPEPAIHKPPHELPLHSTQPVRMPQPIADPPPVQQQSLQQEAVLSVPRPTVTYGDREKNELKVKNLRDKLETTISASEDVLKDEAKLAIKCHREGKKASARILLRRRQLTHRKIENCQTMLYTVLEMIDSMDTARDNAKFIESVESGTKAINDIMKDMSVESVRKALDDARQAEEYTKEIGAAMEGEVDSMDDDEFERAVAEVSDKFGVSDEGAKLEPAPAPAQAVPGVAPAPKTKTIDEQIAAIPELPTQQPLPPVTPEPAKQEAEKRVPLAG